MSNNFYSKTKPIGTSSTLYFTKEQELWEDLFLTLTKFIQQTKHLPFEINSVKATLLDLIEQVFEETDDEKEDGEDSSSYDEEEETNNMASEQEIDEITENLKTSGRIKGP